MENATIYWKPAKLIALLIKIVSQGGNFLLDIGPTADGRIPVIMQHVRYLFFFIS
jgi:alpha-L-fucosidase